MSAMRSLSLSNRKVRRESLSSPYSQTGRPSSSHRRPEKKPWSLSAIFSFIASLGFGTKSEDERDMEDPQDDDNMCTTANTTTNSTADAGRPASNLPSGGSVPPIPPPPRATNRPIASGSGLSPSSSDNSFLGSSDASVIEWAQQKVDSQTPMNEMEVLGLKSFFENQRERTYEPEKLRLGSHTPSTPTRSPIDESAPAAPAPPRQPAFSGSTSLPTFTNNASAARASSAPRRMLKKDPNGTLIWRGAGRARSTPAQGRRRPPPDIPKPDASKRRKIYEETSDPGIAPGMATSQSAPVFGSSGVGAGPSTPSRLPRASIIRPRTAPLVSSPLRNVVNNSPPASPPSKSRTSPANSSTNMSANTSANTSQTYTATFLAEVIEKATPPPKQPDVANPYQTAAPVKPVYKPMEKKRMSERRARTREAEKEKEKAKAKEAEKKEPSAKDIIEATVPKGAKRSRPPPGLNKSKVTSTDISEATSKPIVEGPLEESTPRKKSRKVTIEEVFEDDDDVRITSSYVKPAEIIEPQEPASGPVRPPSSVPSNHFGPSLNPKAPTFGVGKSSLPKEPSKLRTSFLADEDENESPKPAAPASPFPSSMTTPSAPLAQVQEKKDPKEIALALPLSELPTFVFKTPPSPIALDHAEARAAAKALPLSALPTFDFSKVKASTDSTEPIPAVKAFDFAAAGLKPAAPTAGGNWECSSCMLQNPASVLEKCTICDAPRLGAEKKAIASMNGMGPSAPASAPAVKAFDFAAAGLKPAAPATGGNWECSSCMLQNPATALEKCTICDAPRPGAEKNAAASPSVPQAMPTPPAAPKAFDWAAAGLAPKPKSSGDSWTCGTCMLSNPPTATEKCSICDAPRS